MQYVALAIRKAATSIVLIVIVACAFRVVFAWDYARQRPRQALSVIPFLFESGNIAHSVAVGKGFSSPFRVDTGPTAWTTPVYPLFLAGLMRLFGPYTFHSWLAAVAANILFSSLSAIPVYFVGKRIGGVGLGAAAAWLWAIFPNAILLSYESLWETCLSALLGAALLWATLRVADSRRLRPWCWYGLLWGVALMSNAALLALAPFLFGWALWGQGFGPTAGLRPGAEADGRLRAGRKAGGGPEGPTPLHNGLIAAAIALACCIPWTIRNYAVFGSFVPLRSTLGLQLWVGNNPKAKVIWLGEQHPIHDTAERESYLQSGEIAYMRQKEHDAIQFMLTHPMHEAELISGRFISFWAGGTPSPIRDFLRNRSAWFRYVLLFNIAVSLGTLLGIIIMIRQRSVYTVPLAVFPVVFPWAYYLTLSLPRYRHAIDPILMLLTAIALKQALARTPVPPLHGIDRSKYKELQ